MSFDIKPITEADALAVSRVHVLSWQAAYKGIVPDEYLDSLSIDSRAERLKHNLAQQTGFQYYAAWLDARIIGTLTIGPYRSTDCPEEKAGEVCAIYLHPDYWNQGYGRLFMAFAVTQLSAQFDRIYLWTLEENKRARRFYEKAGFVFDGTKKEILIGKKLVELRYLYTRKNPPLSI